MDFTDRVSLGTARKTADGFLVADARVARTGIQIYKGFEVGRPDLPEVRVFRPQDEVFSQDSLRTFAHRPVTLGHPTEMVDANNAKSLMVGITDAEIARDGDFVRVPMMLVDKGVIDQVEGGVNQLSMGYTATLDWQDGTAPDGAKFDAVQRNLRMNHLAVVAVARGGSELKIGDDGGKAGEKMTEQTRQITVDSIPVNVPDHAAAVIEKALKDGEAARGELANRLADSDAKIATLEGDIAKKDAELEELKAKALDAAAIDAMVAERSALIATASKIHPEGKFDGMSNPEVKAAVVGSKIGDAIKDKSAAYIDARFDVEVERLKDDPAPGGSGSPHALAATVSGIRKTDGNPANAAYQKHLDEMNGAWKKRPNDKEAS